MRLWEVQTEDRHPIYYAADNTWNRYNVAALTFKSAITKVEKLMTKYERIKSIEPQGKLDC